MVSTAPCGLYPINTVGPPCSGNGECIFYSGINRSLCSCNAGWQGFSDLQVTNDLLDCQINVTAIRVLWGIFLFIHVVVYIRYLPQLRWLWNKHQQIVERNRVNGKVYRIWHNKGIFSLLPYVTIGWWSQTAYALAKIINQDTKLGSSTWITILYLLWRTTFFFCPDTFQPALVESLLKSQRSLDHLIRRNTLLSYLHLGVSWLLGIPFIIPLVIEQDPLNPTVGVTSIVVMFSGGSLSMMFLAVQAIYIEKRVNAILEKSYEISKEPRTKKIMEKMAANQRQVKITGGIQFLVYALFACFPYLWNKHDYMLPYSWVAVASTIRQVVASLVQDEMTTSSARASVPDGDQIQDPIATPQQPVRRPVPPESTVVGTIDTLSIIEIEDADNPTLLATGGNWTRAKAKQVEEGE